MERENEAEGEWRVTVRPTVGDLAHGLIASQPSWLFYFLALVWPAALARLVVAAARMDRYAVDAVVVLGGLVCVVSLWSAARVYQRAPVELQSGPEGLLLRRKGQAQRIAWSSLSVRETSRAFVFTSSKHGLLGFPCPKRILDEARIAELRTLASGAGAVARSEPPPLRRVAQIWGGIALFVGSYQVCMPDGRPDMVSHEPRQGTCFHVRRQGACPPAYEEVPTSPLGPECVKCLEANVGANHVWLDTPEAEASVRCATASAGEGWSCGAGPPRAW
jgi:hypothetical protein